MTVALREGGHDYLMNIQIIYTECHAYNVNNGIDCPYFMKMHLINGKPVGLGFCLCHDPKHFPGQLFHTSAGIQTVDDLIYVIEISVNVMVGMYMTVRLVMAVMMAGLMTVCMLVTVALFMTVPMLMTLALLQMHIKIKNIQPAGLPPSKMEMIPTKPHAVQSPYKSFLIRSQIQQRPYGHISADSRITFQVKYFSHFISPPVCLFALPHIRLRIHCQYLPRKSRWHRN